MARPSLEDDLGPDALAREQLEQDRVRDPAVDDVGLRGPALERPQRRLDLRQHPARDHPGRHEPLGLLATQRADQPLSRKEADRLMSAGVIAGGMLPQAEIGKAHACSPRTIRTRTPTSDLKE